MYAAEARERASLLAQLKTEQQRIARAKFKVAEVRASLDLMRSNALTNGLELDGIELCATVADQLDTVLATLT